MKIVILLFFWLLLPLSILSGELHEAVKPGDLKKAEEILQKSKKDDINELNEEGFSLLHLACAGYGANRENLELVKLLLQNGADINLRGDNKETPLHVAAESYIQNDKDDGALIYFLVDAGADINALNGYGFTPASFFTWSMVDNKGGRDSLEILDFLIDHGADLKAGASQYHLPHALRAFHYPLVNRLMTAGVREADYESLAEAVAYSATYNKSALLFACLELGFPADHPVDTRPALNLAAEANHLEIVKLLIKYGADVNASNIQNQNTALMAAAWKGNIEIVESLLDSGADLNLTNRGGRNILMFFILKEYSALAQRVIEGGVKINQPDNEGYTPLMLAAQKGDARIIQVLLNAGADPFAVNNKGEDAFFLAKLSDNAEAVQLLQKFFDNGG